MLAIILTAFFLLDILLAVLSARAAPGAVIRKVAMVFFALQLLFGVGGGSIAVFRTLTLQP